MQRVIANTYRTHGRKVCGGYLFILRDGGGSCVGGIGELPLELDFGGVRRGLVPLCGLRSVLKLVAISEGESGALITRYATGAVYALIAFVNSVARRPSCGDLAVFSIIGDHSSN